MMAAPTLFALLAWPLAWVPGDSSIGHPMGTPASRAGVVCESGAGSGRGSARFVLVDSTGRRPLEYADANLVFCRTTSATMVWIRLADSPVNDGNESPHLDIDVCHLGSGGAFTPMEARARPCPGGKTWAVWWHEGAGQAYANRAASPGCTLHLEVEERELRGTFSCQGLVTEDGQAAVDILEGSFECVREDTPALQGAARGKLPS